FFLDIVVCFRTEGANLRDLAECSFAQEGSRIIHGKRAAARLFRASLREMQRLRISSLSDTHTDKTDMSVTNNGA
ncbi:hypothetical protein, partial [Salipaludibacillus sp. CF4.18]|uniref:hypothetical protein n=1 Tax=Salipaludibacillus sp. CF4.18 TaxID=3373081 RepID=UPI003EE51ED1